MRNGYAWVLLLPLSFACALLPFPALSQESQPAETRQELLSRGNKILSEMSARVASGELEQARTLAQELVNLNGQLSGPNSLLAAGALLNLAGIELRLQDYAAAEATARRALVIYDLHGAARNPALARNDIALAFDFLGLALKGQAIFGPARVILEEALRIYQEVLGPDHLLVGAAHAEIGEILEWLGDYAAARHRYQRALQIARHTTTDPSAAGRLQRLAMLLWRVGNHQGAKEVLELAVQVAEQSGAGDSAPMAETLLLFSTILKGVGDQDGAYILAERSLHLMERLRGPDHPEVALVLTQLGEVLSRKGDVAGASRVLLRAGGIYVAYSNTFPKGKVPDWVLLSQAKHLNVTALVHGGAGRLDLARETLQQSLKMYQLIAPEHPDAGVASGRLAVLLREAGDLQSAWSHFERALHIFRRMFGPNHWYVADALLGMATVKWVQGDVPGAAQLFLDGKHIHEGNFDRLFVGMSHRQRLLAISTYRFLLDATLTLPPSVLDANSSYSEVLRWKNVAFQAALSERPSVQPGTDRAATLYQQYVAARRELAGLALRAPPRDNPDTHTLAIARRTQEIERLEQDLSRESAAFRKEIEGRHVSPSEVCASLPPSSALIDPSSAGTASPTSGRCRSGTLLLRPLRTSSPSSGDPTGQSGGRGAPYRSSPSARA